MKTFDDELVAEFFVDSRDESVRLRREGHTYFLTRKDNIRGDNGVKSADEYETEVSDPEATRNIFRSLGFKRVRTVTKWRTLYLVGEAKVVIDDYGAIPPLLEIEAATDDIVRRTAILLGYRAEDLVTDTVRDLEKRYGVQLGIPG